MYRLKKSTLSIHKLIVKHKILLEMKKYFLSLFITAIAGGFVALAAYKTIENKHLFATKSDYELPTQFVNYRAPVNGQETDFVPAAEMTVHTVVNIRTEFVRKTSLYDDFFGFFGNQNQQVTASGSGVIIADDGYIVTNNHVVQDAEKIEVTLNNKRTFIAKIIGTDPSTDLALLKIDAKELPTVKYGNSDNIRIGEWVLAVGNPFNLTSTVTAGIISAKARNINILGKNSNETPIESFIQTDAAVNPGNSGGALVNTKGELIGINAAIASSTGSYSGYSFAIPVNIVRKVVEDLKLYGIVQRAFLGVSIAEIDEKLAENKKLNGLKGVYIGAVTENGSASKAGIKEGDILVGGSGKNVNSNSELLETVGQYRPGDKVLVNIIRDDKPMDIEVLLQNQYGKAELVKKEEKHIVSLLGANFEALSNENLRKYGLNNGVMITKLGSSILFNAGIREGFIVTGIDKNVVRNTNDVKVYTNKKGKTFITGTYPGDWRTYYFVIYL